MIIKSLILTAGLISAASLSARTFTSSDGSKTIEAELIDYDPSSGKIVIRNEGSNRNVTVEAGAFSKKDQAYFEKFIVEATKRKALSIRADDKSEDLEEKSGGIYIYDRKNEFFNVTISNSGPVEINDLTAKYDIYVTRYDKQGKKTVDMTSGSESFSSIDGKSNTEFKSLAVKVTSGCATSSSCPKCKTHAASVRKERVIGIHVRLYDDKGDMLTEFYSSGSVKSAAEKKSSQS